MLMPPQQLREISRGFGHGHTGIDLMAPFGTIPGDRTLGEGGPR